jgi:pilus assembly protein CpaF
MRNLVLQITAPDGTRVRQALVKVPFLVGRAQPCDLVLDDPQVSRRHLEISEQGDALGVTDSSANGTFIKGARIPAGRWMPWGENEPLRVGAHTLLLTEPALVPSADAAAGPPTERPRPVSDMSTREFKQHLHRELLQRMDLRWVDHTAKPRQELFDEVHGRVRELITEIPDVPPEVDNAEIARQVTYDVVGLGPLEDLLADPTITEIMVVSADLVFVEKQGKIVETDVRFTSDDTLMSIIERIVAPIGKRIDESSPMVDARLHDGSRVNAIIPPLALKGPCLTIRKFSRDPLGIDDLVRFGTMSAEMADFMRCAVTGKRNVVISGGTGSGKTTLLNVFSAFIPGHERIITMEDSAELRLSQTHVISLESKPPNVEGRGAFTIRDLVKNALRMRPDRIVVGECRGGEALDMLQAMNTGHSGSMTTIHANSPVEALHRLETMVLMSGMNLPSHAIREQIAAAAHLIVQQNRYPDGSRRITHITEVLALDEEGFFKSEDVFVFEHQGYDRAGRVRGRSVPTGYIPSFVPGLLQMGIEVPERLFKV